MTHCRTASPAIPGQCPVWPSHAGEEPAASAPFSLRLTPPPPRTTLRGFQGRRTIVGAKSQLTAVNLELQGLEECTFSLSLRSRGSPYFHFSSIFLSEEWECSSEKCIVPPLGHFLPYVGVLCSSFTFRSEVDMGVGSVPTWWGVQRFLSRTRLSLLTLYSFEYLLRATHSCALCHAPGKAQDPVTDILIL